MKRAREQTVFSQDSLPDDLLSSMEEPSPSDIHRSANIKATNSRRQQQQRQENGTDMTNHDSKRTRMQNHGNGVTMDGLVKNRFYEEEDDGMELALQVSTSQDPSTQQPSSQSQHNATVMDVQMSMMDEMDDMADGFHSNGVANASDGHLVVNGSTTWSTQRTPPRNSVIMSSKRHHIKKITQEDRERAKRMVQQERKKWEKAFLQKTDDSAIRDTYTSFAKLQALTQEHRLSFDTPEVVIVGMQSDGKSSFIEALLGFQFNTVDTQIGTRRPLLLQMLNNKEYTDEPRCTFMREDNSGWEAANTPARDLEHEIRKRTEERCGSHDVSPVPIIIQVEYAYCANLNIYDTPGFRKGKDDPLRSRIAKMNQHLLRDKNRIIVCLEQSTVEWCNTQIRPTIRAVDPTFERTFFIATKFGNRVNQFKSEEEINGYLSTDGALPDPERVFFMSLPSGVEARSLDDPREYQRAIVETYLDDYEVMCKIGFDHRQYKRQMGFMRVQKFLEQELFRRYQKTVNPLIARISRSIEKRKTHRETLSQRIEQMEKEDVEKTINNMLHEYVRLINSALHGTNDFDASTNGMTLEEERAKSTHATWPNFSLDIPFLNSQYKLYGGAQLMRLLSEFEIVAHSQECPQITDDEVAVTIGLGSLHTFPSPERGASDLAQKKCRAVLRPLIDVLIERYRFIAKHTVSIIVNHMVGRQQDQQSHKKHGSNAFGGGGGGGDLEIPLTQEGDTEQETEPATTNSNHRETVTSTAEGKFQFQGFFEELQRISNTFIDKLLRVVCGLAADEFDTFTRVIDWDLIANSNIHQPSDYDLLAPTSEDTRRRVEAIIRCPEMDPTLQEMQSDRGKEMTEERCRRMKLMAAKLFGGVRLMFVKFMRAKFNMFFVDPIFKDMDEFLHEHFRKLGSDQLKELAGLQIQKLKQERERGDRYVTKAQLIKEEFEALQHNIASMVITAAEAQKQ